MDSQRLRILIGGVLALVALLCVLVLTLFDHQVPSIFEWATVATIAYLFGVTTNGNGLGGRKA